MALIPGFEYDIFISYAHLDNQKLPDEQVGWIKKFYEYLNIMLAKRYGRNGVVKIWWDSKKLDGSVLFDASIADGINKSAVMICLNSSSYNQSEYCQQELDMFYKKAQADKTGLKVGHQSRIVHVLLNNIPFKDWPHELDGAEGFSFHDSKDEDDFGEALESITPEFKAQMKSLKDAVWSLLENFPKEEIRNNKTETKSVESNQNKDSFCVYLAEVSDSLRSVRKRIIAELDKKGYKTIVGVLPSDDVQVHDEATKTVLDEAKVSIHLLDQFPGREITENTNTWYTKRQTEIALNDNTPQIIWVSEQIDFDEIEEEEYKIFMIGLEDGNNSGKNYEYIKGTKSSLIHEITDYIDQVKIESQTAKKIDNSESQEPMSVLLDYHANDINYGRDLSNTLIENQITAYFAPTEDDPQNNNEKYRKRLMQAKKFVFLYGKVEKDWVDERVKSTLKKLIDCNRFDPDIYKDIYIYMAPPFKDESIINLPNVRIFNYSNNDMDEDKMLNQFVNDLKTEVRS